MAEMRKGTAARVYRAAKDNLLSEEQGENAETFSERHTDDGLNEDFAGSGGITADSFGSFESDQTDAESGAEKTKRAGDIAGEFSDGEHRWWYYFVVGCRRAHVSTLPTVNALVLRCIGSVYMPVIVMSMHRMI